MTGGVPEPALAAERVPAIRAAWRGVFDMDVIDLVTRLSLLLFIYSDWVVTPEWSYKLLLRLPAVAALLLPPLHRSRAVWWWLTAVMAFKSVSNWAIQDNHLFVDTYWCGAIAVALGSGRPHRVLAANGRVLIGLAFALAVLWKGVLSNEFMDGRYFEFTLLTDARFERFSELAGGLSSESAEANRAAMAAVTDPLGTTAEVSLDSTRGIGAVAQAMTWYTIVLEVLVAIAFLWPARRALWRWRDTLLMMFAWTVYLVVSVNTFGWTLMTMGLAQTDPGARRTRGFYLLSLVVVLVYEYVPVVDLAGRAIGR